MFSLKRSTRRAALSLAMAFTMAFSGVTKVHADNTIELEEITGRGGSLTVPAYGAAVARARNVAGGASVVDTEKTRRGRSATLDDTLGFAPGVFIQSRAGGEEARLSIRGSGLSRTFHGRGLLLLQDGVPLNLADGGFDFQAVEPFATRYVAVYRGANALGFGSASLGGAINYVARTGHNASPFQARYEGGSHNYHRAQVSTGRVNGDTDYYASASEYYYGGFRTHSRQNAQRVFTNVGTKISENAENRAYLTYVRTDSELPGSLTKAQLKRNPRLANATNVTGDQKRDFNLFRLADKVTVKSGDSQLDAGAFYSWKQLDHPIFQVLDQLTHDMGASVIWTGRAPLAGKKNTLIVGAVPTLGFTRDLRYQNVRGARGAQTADSRQRSYNLTGFVEDSLGFTDKATFVVGTQYAYAVRKNDDRFPVTVADKDNSDRQSYAGWSPKAGLRYDITPHAQVYGNVSRSFEAPSFGELVGNNTNGGLVELDEQTATTYEVGTRGESSRIAWDATVYHARLQKELLSLTTPTGTPLGTVNADRTVHQGVELGLEIALIKGLAVEGPNGDRLLLRNNFTWNDFRFNDDRTFGDNEIAGIPKQISRAELQYEHPAGFYAGPNVEWVSNRTAVDHKNTFFANPYAIVGFKAGYAPSKGWTVFVDARNLADKEYAATTGVTTNASFADTAQFLPGDGRSYYAGVEFRY